MISYLLYNVLSIFEVLLIIRIVLSWIHKERAHKITIWICDVIDPILKPIQRILPGNSIGIDFSPIIIFILIDLLKQLIVRSIYY